MDEHFRGLERTIRKVAEEIKLKVEAVAAEVQPDVQKVSLHDLLMREEEVETQAVEHRKKLDKIEGVEEFKQYCEALLLSARKEHDDAVKELKEFFREDLKSIIKKGEDVGAYISNALDEGIPKEYLEIGEDLEFYYTNPPKNTSGEKNRSNDTKFNDNGRRKDLYVSILTEPRLPKKLEIVVAHYKEALEWLNPFISHPLVRVNIYSKGGKDLPPLFHNYTNYLPNIGCGVHTYLRHIVARYESLEDITLFCQGDPFESFQVGYTPKELLKDALKTTDEAVTFFKGQRIEKFDSWDGIDFDEFDLGMNTKIIKPAAYTPGEYWMLFMGPLGYKLPQSTRFAPGANFAITKDRIKKYPKSFWMQVFTELFLGPMEDPNPMTSIICERLLPAMIDPINMMVPTLVVDPMDMDQ